MKSFLVLLLSISIHCAFAQQKTPLLEKKMTISFTNEKLSNVLNRISQEGKFSFSYNSSIIADDKAVTINANNKSVREILNEIFKGTMEYKQKNNHLILTKVQFKQTQTSTTVVILSGYVEDAETKEKISDVSVYDKKSITSVVTDEYGYFKMKLDKKEDAATIAISKKNYKDTLVSITSPGNQYLNISITPIEKDSIIIHANTTATPPDTLAKEEKKDDPFTLPYEDEPNVKNIKDTLHRDVQISFLPFLGSNGRLSGNIINDYSINILGGYSMGTNQIELGFFFNIDRGNARWLQIAGFGNLVGGDFYGLQGSGFFNVNGGSVVAAQASGFGNVNFKDFSGVQWAGFTNVNLGGVHGASVSGFANVTRGLSRGVQIAGFANVQAGDYKGSQVAGFTNIATEKIDGSQISAFYNYGKKVRGSQIALLNYADSLGGVPIGLLSIVKHGYHKIELAADEVFYMNVAYRTGIRQFYNIVFAGMQPELDKNDNKAVWTLGYGLGTAPRLARWLDLNIDITSQHVNKGGFTTELSSLNKVYLGFDFHLAKKFSITTGITLNAYLTKTTFNDYAVLFTDFQPRIFNEHNFDNNTNLKMWWGGKVGIRFL